MSHYTYLLVNFLTVFFCFIFSYHPKIGFNRFFIPFLKSALLVALPFIAWDAWFAHTGVWWFNDRYLVGIRILQLPIEEWLFFICIPFSCLFTWYVINNHYPVLQKTSRYQKPFITVCILAGIILAILSYGKAYPFTTLIITTASLIYLQFIAKTPWLAEISVTYTLLLIPFFIVNGILTGTGLDQPVVNYNPVQFSNLRILTIPIEDAAYGYILIVWNLYFFKLFTRPTHEAAPRPSTLHS